MTWMTDDLYCLPAPSAIPEVEDIRPRHLQQLFSVLRNQFSHIVVDCQWPLDATTMTVLDLPDTILLVGSPEAQSIYSAKRAMKFLQHLEYPAGKIKLVVNRYDRSLKPEELQRALGAPIEALLTRDAPAARTSMNLGQPLIYSHPKSPLVSQFANLARKVAGELTPEDGVNTRRFWGPFSAFLRSLVGRTPGPAPALPPGGNRFTSRSTPFPSDPAEFIHEDCHERLSRQTVGRIGRQRHQGHGPSVE
jgi:Flp pilus assembly CpaE family ATPase